MEYRNILRDVKDKKLSPIYFLMGEEAYFIDVISNYISETVLSPEEKEFNQTVLYGKDTNVEQIVSNVKSYPMMAEKRVVILKEAQQFKDLDKLEGYFQKPVPSTVFVICYKYGEPDKRKKVFKGLDANKNILTFKAKKLSENLLIDWIRNYCIQRKIQIDPKAAFALKEMLGDDLNRIAKEIDKFTSSLPEGSQIRLEEVATNVGMSREYNTFELQSALAAKNIIKANRIATFFARNPSASPMPVTMGVLYSFFIKALVAKTNNCKNEQELRSRFKLYMQEPDLTNTLKNYSLQQLRNIMSLLHEYDLKSKGVGAQNADYGDLLRELVFRITHEMPAY